MKMHRQNQTIRPLKRRTFHRLSNLLTQPTDTLRPAYTIHARDFLLPLGVRTQIMGIVNVTPDSFSRDGCMQTEGAPATDYTARAVRLAKRLIRQGADIIDIGGESSRPGSRRISAAEERTRIIPAIQQLAKQVQVPISVDTYKPAVAREALDAGASLINTIKGADADKSLLRMIRRYNAAVVLMHMRGMPRTMQQRVHYENLISEIVSSLQKSIEICLEIGIKSDKIIIDPGIGFGKTVEHNLAIIRRLKEFECLHCPILIGTSRKSFIGKVLGDDTPQRLLGTAASVSASILNGAHIIRVHDVRQMRDIAQMTDRIAHHHTG